MKLKHALSGLGLSAAAFAGCAVVMVYFHQQLSSMGYAVIYAFMALWGVSGIAGPILFIKATEAGVRAARERLRHRESVR